MNQGNSERHEHGGKSSKGMFNDREVLLSMGLIPGQTFIDGGCAAGHFSIEASNIVEKSGRVFSVDVHAPSLKELRKTIDNEAIENITVLKEDLRSELSIQDNSADHFFMSNVLHGFVFNNECRSVLNNVVKTMKDDGRFTIIEWDHENVENGPPRDHRLSVDEVSSILAEFDLELESASKPTMEHNMMIFRKINRV